MSVARGPVVWTLIRDVRTPAQRRADEDLDVLMPDERDPLEVLRQEAMAILDEYEARRAAQNNVSAEECLGCQVRRRAREEFRPRLSVVV